MIGITPIGVMEIHFTLAGDDVLIAAVTNGDDTVVGVGRSIAESLEDLGYSIEELYDSIFAGHDEADTEAN